MSIIYNDTQEKSELQQRITAELREKQASKSLNDGDGQLPQRVSARRSINTSMSDSGHKGIRITLIVIGIVLAVCLIAGLISFVMSSRAINDYIGAVDTQYQQISNNKNIEQTNVKLNNVFFGEILNYKYKRVAKLDGEYQRLINNLRNYTRTMTIHNELVKKFNTGIEGNEILTGDILNLANSLLNEVKRSYPDKTKEITKLELLCSKISSNSKFTDISGEVSTVLHDNDAWLNEIRDQIERDREVFQNKINNL